MNYKYSSGIETLEAMQMQSLTSRLKNLVLVGAALGTAYAVNLGPVKHLENAEYQGHISMGKGIFQLVFDDEPVSVRMGKPDLVANGNPDEFERGRLYDLEYRNPFIGDKYIISAK